MRVPAESEFPGTGPEGNGIHPFFKTQPEYLRLLKNNSCRIDDPDAGWKGRGLWATISTRAPFHMEGGKGTTSKAIHFQLRPDPLAR